MPKSKTWLLCCFCLGLSLSSYEAAGQVDHMPEGQSAGTSPHVNRRTTIKFGPLFSSSGVSAGLSYMEQRSDYVGFGGELDFSKYALSGPYSFLTLTANYRIFPFAADRLFLTARAGYGLPMSAAPSNADLFESNGGLALAGAVGYRLGTRTPTLEVSMGVRSQKASFLVEEFGTVLIEDAVYKRLELSIGMSF